MNKYIILSLLLSSRALSNPAAEQQPPTNLSANQTTPNQPSTTKPTEIPLPNYSCIDLGPLDNNLCDMIISQAPEEIRDYIELVKQSKEAKTPEEIKLYESVIQKKLLLVGKTGVGKTTLALAIAQKMNKKAYLIQAPMLGSEYQNSEVSTLTRLIKLILAGNKNNLIIIDEINILAEPKNSLFGPINTAASALWLMLDWCAQYKDTLVIGTANDITKLPPQLKDRFEGSIIEIKMEDSFDRCCILEHYLSKRKHRLSDHYIRALAHKTKSFSPRQLEALITAAAQNQVIRHLPHKSLGFSYILNEESNELSLDHCIDEEDIEKAYNKFLSNTNLLKPSFIFSVKELLKEYSQISPAVSGTLYLGFTAIAISYGILKGKKPIPPLP